MPLYCGLRGVGAYAVEALQRELGGDLGVLGDQRCVGARAHGELVAQALGIGEAQAIAHALVRDALGAEALRPEAQRLLGGDARDDPVHHPGARAARDGARVLEEGQLRAGAALLVGVEQVVDARIVLVDGLGHQSQAQHAGVEVDVARRVARDRRDVVNAFEPHALGL